MINIEKICLTEKQVKKLITIADEAAFEVCALLLGEIKDKKAICKEVKILKNIAISPEVSFLADIHELYLSYLYAEKIGLDVVGIFHSHPAPPSPSHTDLKFMEINPVPWIIYSKTVNRDKLKAYQFSDNKVCEIKIEIM
ncbi:MAG: Mov34/MPN/PAD-1 family protein [Candidatus Odinarchaeia archaeon]